MKFIFTLIIALVLIPYPGRTQTGETIYNAGDVAVLKKIAQDNSNFVYRDDWLSETPEWNGVTWGGDPSDTRVVKLDLKDSHVTTLDVSLLDKLVELNCYGSSMMESLQHLQIEGLSKLQKLNCHQNIMTELTLTGLSSLQELDCSFNKLETIELGDLNSLLELDCGYNDIKQLNISSNPNLTKIICEGNCLPFSGLLPLLAIPEHNLKSQYEVGEELEFSRMIDFTCEANMNGSATQFKWFHYPNEGEVTPAEMETLAPGKFNFNIAGEFYCEMTNPLFPGVTVISNRVAVEGEAKQAGDVVALKQIAQENPMFIYREDWLSENPQWKGVTWGGDIQDARVVKLNLSTSNLKTLDVTPLKNLVELDCCVRSSIENIKVRDLPLLQKLNCMGNEITQLDLTGLPSLQELDCSYNNLETINVNNLANLIEFNCSFNSLTQLDVSQNLQLKNISCINNALTFKTLLPLLSIEKHFFQDQKEILDAIESTGLVDYSSESMMDGTATQFKWFRRVWGEVTPEEIETLAPGIFDFKVAGEFYCEMTNALFPDMTLTTKPVKVVGEAKNEADIAVLRQIAQENANFIYREDWLSDNPEWKGVIWGGDLQNPRVLKVDLQDPKITHLDVTGLTELIELDCIGGHLAGDKIQTLKVAGLSKLQKLKCDLNAITELNLSGLANLQTVNCGNNKLVVLTLTGCANLQRLNFNGNSLGEIDLRGLSSLKYLECFFNNLKQIDVSQNPNLQEIKCEYNFLSFSNLYPLLAIEKHDFSFQNVIGEELESTGSVDFSGEADINGTPTAFKWFYRNGGEVSPEEVEMVAPGKFNFKVVGEFYCEMTNVLFPDLKLKTKLVTIVGGQKNEQDVTALRTIAQENPEFIYREDWLSETPEWKGVIWAGDMNNVRVKKLQLKRSHLTNLDVSPLNELTELDCSFGYWDSKIQTLKVEGLSKLEILKCNNNEITALNLSGLTNLRILRCEANQLTLLGLEDLVRLEELNCDYNYLKEIDISKNPNLTQITCRRNFLPFSAVFPLLGIDILLYSNQSKIFEEISSQQRIDFSSEAKFNGVATSFKWYHSYGTELMPDEVETIEPGVFDFKIAGDFYCEMTNLQFPELTLTTNSVLIEGITRNENDIATLRSIARANPEFIHRDDWLSENPKWEGVSWGGPLNDIRVIHLQLMDAKITQLDVSPLAKLIELDCSSPNTNYRYNVISLTVEGLQELQKLNCSDNYILTLDLTDLTQLRRLDCQYNDLTELDLSLLVNLTQVDCSHNNLEKLLIDENNRVQKLDAIKNKLPFSMLFPLRAIDYTWFSLQKEIFEPLTSTGIVDYSRESEFEGSKTQFQWFYKDGSEIPSYAIELLEPGLFNFQISGEFYCEMTNPLFPDVTLTSSPVTINAGVDQAALNDPWKAKRNFSGGARKGAVGFALGGYGYLGLGENGDVLKDFWMYNTSDDSWEKLEDCPFEARKNAVGFSVNGKGYVGLGENDTQKLTDFWQFDGEQVSWTHVTDYPGSNSRLASWVVHNDKVYFFCGKDEAGNYSREVWEYDPVANQWTQKQDFPGDVRIYAFAYSIDNKVYLGNGQSYEDGMSWMTNDLWEYDPETDAWKDKDMILDNSVLSPSYFSIQGKGYYGLSGFSAGSFCELDPAKGEWTGSLFPYVDDTRNLNDPVIFVINGLAYVCTGALQQGINNETLLADVITFEPPLPPMMAPNNLTAELVGDFEVKLTWEDVADREVKQEIRYSCNGDEFKLFTQLDPDVETYTASGLEPSTSYTFKVVAIDENGEMAESEEVSITTNLPLIMSPTNVKIELVDALKARITWKDNSRAETHQELYCSTDKVSGVKYEVASDVESYTTSKLSPETTYYFQVYSISEWGDSEKSEQVQITTGKDPHVAVSGLVAELVSDFVVLLTWTDNSSVEVEQRVMMSTDGEKFNLYAQLGANVVILYTHPLEPTTTYYFKIINYDKEGYSRESQVVQVTTGQYTGLQEVFEEEMLMYPNPASDKVCLKLPGTNTKQILILDDKGREVASFEAVNMLRIDVSNLEAGIYFINIRTNQMAITKRLVVLPR